MVEQMKYWEKNKDVKYPRWHISQSCSVKVDAGAIALAILQAVVLLIVSIVVLALSIRGTIFPIQDYVCLVVPLYPVILLPVGIIAGKPYAVADVAKCYQTVSFVAKAIRIYLICTLMFPVIFTAPFLSYDDLWRLYLNDPKYAPELYQTLALLCLSLLLMFYMIEKIASSAHSILAKYVEQMKIRCAEKNDQDDSGEALLIA